jgi:hypothetical protein
MKILFLKFLVYLIKTNLICKKIFQNSKITNIKEKNKKNYIYF